MPKRRSPRPAPPFHYRATVTSVYDGDTCTVDLDLGLSITLHEQKIRLARINAPELRGRSKKRGRAARDFLRGIIQEKEILLQTIKDRKGKYGRYLGELWVKQGRKMVNVNDLLVAESHAKFVDY
jgi:micrococcal nuclease